MVAGNVVLAMAWSGDIIVKQAEKDTLVWQLPDEGGMLWTDNMLIPKGAQHKYTAELFVNFVYDPAIAAQIAEYVNYVTPVKGAKEVLAADDPEMAENPLTSSATMIVAIITTAMAMTISPSSLPTRSSSFCNGVVSSAASLSMPAMRPISVCMPVAATTASPRP